MTWNSRILPGGLPEFPNTVGREASYGWVICCLESNLSDFLIIDFTIEGDSMLGKDTNERSNVLLGKPAFVVLRDDHSRIFR
jgi:hypothetical protein